MRTGSSVRVHRTLHLIDIDNLLGDPCTFDRELIEETFAAYRSVAGYVEGDHVVVAAGCNGLHVLEVERAWPGVLHRRRSGPHGADVVLLEEAESVLASRLYDRVVIGSGDGLFVVAFDRLTDAGFHVTVVSRCAALSSALVRRAGEHVRPLELQPAGVSVCNSVSAADRAREGSRMAIEMTSGGLAVTTRAPGRDRLADPYAGSEGRYDGGRADGRL